MQTILKYLNRIKKIINIIYTYTYIDLVRKDRYLDRAYRVYISTFRRAYAVYYNVYYIHTTCLAAVYYICTARLAVYYIYTTYLVVYYNIYYIRAATAISLCLTSPIYP